jgi:hypothetical protein
VLAAGRCHAQAPVPALTDAEIQARIERLQRELDELKAILKQRTVPPATASAPPSGSPVTTAAPGRFRLSGFLQVRAFDDQTTTNAPKRRDQFNVRRARIDLSGDLARNLLARLTFDVGSTAVGARDLYLDVRTRPVLFRLGQFKLPFDYEILQPGTEVMPTERALVNQRLFPGVRDRGVMADVDLAPSLGAPLSLQLGLFNGTGPNQNDNNPQQDLLGSIAYDSPHFQARIAAVTGVFTFTPTGAAAIRTTKHRAGISLRGLFDPWEIHGQYTQGHGDFPAGGGAPALTGAVGTTGAFSNRDVRGWYLLASRRLPPRPITIWGKFEQFDPDVDAPGDTISIFGVGSIWDATTQLRLTLGVFRKAFRTVPQKTTVGFQTQVKF